MILTCEIAAVSGKKAAEARKTKNHESGKPFAGRVPVSRQQRKQLRKILHEMGKHNSRRKLHAYGGQSSSELTVQS